MFLRDVTITYQPLHSRHNILCTGMRLPRRLILSPLQRIQQTLIDRILLNFTKKFGKGL